jgi:cytochrome c oxidase subunit 2
MGAACARCHAIRGTAAQGTVGPDLTHVGSRTALAALTIPNTPAEMLRWISDPQSVKPEAKMPALHLSPGQFRDIVAYLEGLR